jgi:hypothetical protein
LTSAESEKQGLDALHHEISQRLIWDY